MSTNNGAASSADAAAAAATDKLKQSITEFTATLRDDPAVIEFRAAEATLESDPAFARLSEDYNARVREFQTRQTEGTLTQDDINSLRELQARVNEHPAAQRFIAAREEVSALVHDCNHEISSLLGFDFGAAAGPRGGCSC